MLGMGMLSEPRALHSLIKPPKGMKASTFKQSGMVRTFNPLARKRSFLSKTLKGFK